MDKLREILKDFKLKVEKERIDLKQYEIVNPVIKTSRTIFKAHPISYSFENPILNGNKGIFINTFNSLKFQYALRKNPYALFLRKKPEHPVYSRFPIFFLKENLDGNFKLSFSIKEKERKLLIWKTVIGYGPTFFNVIVDISKEYNTKILEVLLKKFFSINLPRGVRLRFLFVNDLPLPFIEQIINFYSPNLFNFVLDKPIDENTSFVLKLNGNLLFPEKLLSEVNQFGFPSKNLTIFDDILLKNTFMLDNSEGSSFYTTAMLEKTSQTYFSLIHSVRKNML